MNKIKVKKALSGRFKNNKLTVVLAVAIASIFLLILLKAWLSEDSTMIESLSESIGISSPQVPSQSTQFYPTQRPITFEEAKVRIKKANLDRIRELTEQNSYRAQQDRLIREFQKTIHLKMKFPEHLHYHRVDMEDDIGAIVGTTTNLDQSFGVLATSRKVNPSDVVGYLKDEVGALPMLRGHEFQLDKSFTFNPPGSTNLGTMTVIPATDHEGKGLYGVFAPRADGKGNYFFMMEAERRYFEANEDGFEQMLDGMKAEP